MVENWYQILMQYTPARNQSQIYFTGQLLRSKPDRDDTHG
jgi:hypothetical protein